MTSLMGSRAPARTAGAGSAFVGTAALVRLALRRDRILLPAWVVVFVVIAGSSASATVGLYPTVAARVRAAVTFNNTPALVALYGKVYDPTSLGAIAMLKLTGLGAAMVAVLAMVLVVRHTRAEEENGRLELLGATVVGRHAALTAALIVAIGTSLVLGLLTAAALIGAGLPWTGSVAFGLSWAAVGAAFAAVAAATAQLSRSARTATGLAACALGIAYLLRAIGDSSGEDGPGWLSWLSPVGWGQQVRAYAGDTWWVLGLPLGFTVVVGGVAYALIARRDHGAGLLADRPGPASASRWLGNPFGLAWRLHRMSFWGWLGAFIVLGAVFGSIADNVAGLLDTPQAQEYIALLGGRSGLSDAFLAAELGAVGVIAAVYGVQATQRLHTEEIAGRAELLLATSLDRLRWVAGHLAVALGGSAALLIAAGLSAGTLYASSTGNASQVGRVLSGALAHIPAAWVLVGIVTALSGWAPRAVMLGWAAVVGFLVLGEVGPLLRLNHYLLDVSPFAHVAKLPGGPYDPVQTAVLLGVTAALLVFGLVGFRRRDIG